MEAARAANSRLGLQHLTSGAPAEVSSINLFFLFEGGGCRKGITNLDEWTVLMWGKNEILTQILESGHWLVPLAGHNACRSARSPRLSGHWLVPLAGHNACHSARSPRFWKSALYSALAAATASLRKEGGY